MVDPSVINEWLKKADEDFGFAVSVIEDSTFYAQICFHFHQAAEKYLKSFIISRDLEFQKTARNTMKKNRKINIRISENDLSADFT